MKKISELLREVDELLNDGEDVRFGTGKNALSYTRAQVLKKTDPIAYRCAVLDYADAIGVDIDELEDDESF